VNAVSLTLDAVDGLARVGVKGPRAAEWLAARGVPVPAQPNRWLAYGDGACLRLGIGEYFVEGTDEVRVLARSLAYETGVYPVLRQDAGWRLAGGAVDAVLEQACRLDLRGAAARDADLVVLTSMLGVGVQVIWRASEAGRAYHVWCDASYADYFGAALAEIVHELGGQVTSLKAGGKG
jgi:sarcosine oxidase subunit gamma